MDLMDLMRLHRIVNIRLKVLTVDFSYLNFEDHPRGKLMLQYLLKNNFYPKLVIEECSTEADKGKLEQLDYLGGYANKYVNLSVREICKNNHIPYEKVSNHNNEMTVELLLARKFSYVVLGDTRILKKPIIEAACDGVINVHPGFLPIVRGNNPYIWALALNLPQGVTVHFIDRGVDTGPIILRKELVIDNINSFGHLLFVLNEMCGKLLIESLVGIKKGTMITENQKCGINPTFRSAPKEVIEYAKTKIDVNNKNISFAAI